MAAPDHYAALGLTRGASADTIRHAYRRLAILHHPDRRPGDATATARFQAIVEAWSVLGDPERRAAHDAGRVVLPAPVEPGTSLGELLGKLVDPLLGVKDRRAVDGKDRKYRLAVGLPEVALGGPRVLAVPEAISCDTCLGLGFAVGSLPDVCPRCDGGGDVQRRRGVRAGLEKCPDCRGRGYLVGRPCPDCDGHGRVRTERKVSIPVPAGVGDGERLLVRGAGEPGSFGGRPGDLYVHIEVEPHPVITRDGKDLVMERPVSVLDALAGARVRVPTATGSAVITVPAGTADGTVLRMPGFGVRDPATGARGDQRVTVRLEMPAQPGPDIADLVDAVRGVLGPDAFPETRAFDDALGGGREG